MSFQGDRGGRSRGDSSSRGRGRGDPSGRGRGDSTGRGRGRGDSFERGRGDFAGRGRGDFAGRGRGDFAGRGRGDLAGRGRGDYAGRGRGGPRGDFRGGDRGGFRGGRGDRVVAVYTPPNGVIPQADPAVTKAENAIEKACKEGLRLGDLQLKSKQPLRPGFGARGNPVLLWANLFQMNVSSELVFHRYDINIDPANQPRRKVTQVVRLLLKTLFDTPQLASVKDKVVTDYRSTLLSPIPLDEDRFLTDIPIDFRDENEDEPREGAVRYTIRLQYTNTLHVDDLIRDIMSTSGESSDNDPAPMLQAFNILFNHFVKQSSKLVLLGTYKSFAFDGANVEEAPLLAGLTALRGYFKTTRVATSRLLINVNVSSAAFYPGGKLVDLIRQYEQENGYNKYTLQRFLQRLRIRATHFPGKKNKAGQVIVRPKSIFGLATPDDGNPKDRNRPQVSILGAGPSNVNFWLDEAGPPSSKPAGGKKKSKGSAPIAGPSLTGRHVTVSQYFRQKYNIQLDSRLPVINVGNKANPSYLPAEVCEVFPGQVFNRQLSPKQTAAMIQFAVRPPAENAASIREIGHGTVGLFSTNPLLAHYGIKVSKDLITVSGRVLSVPNVTYHGNKDVRPQAGSWNLKDIKFSVSGDLKKWSYILITPGGRFGFSSIDQLKPVMGELQDSLLKTGVRAGKPTPGTQIHIQDYDGPNALSQLEDTMAKLAGNHDLLLIALPYVPHPLYHQIKRLGDVKYGIHTICCGDKLANVKGRVGYLANIGMKFNLKLGGTNQIVKNTGFRIIEQGDTMVVGLDVTHPSPGSKSSAPSIAAMVASIDKNLSQWPATIRIQSEAGKEQVDDLSDMLTRHLQIWHKHHRKYPANIVIYRDGVSEGQNDMVLDKELPRLRSACVPLYPATETAQGLPRMTVIIVRKRHHVRFYPTNTNHADNTSNCQPGTVVDRGVTEARKWDFYLQPHTALKGTARPAYYLILLDEVFQTYYRKNNLPPGYASMADVVEELTHGMSYAYGRATKAVRVCPPARYADMVCTRARCYLSNLFEDSARSTVTARSAVAYNEDVLVHEKLRNTMFYI